MDPMVLTLGIFIMLLNVPHCQSSWKLVPTLQVKSISLGMGLELTSRPSLFSPAFVLNRSLF